MSRITKITGFSLALALAALATAGVAQTADEMTADQLEDAFNQQKTRGLVLVPSASTTATTAATTTVEPAADKTYVEVEKENQVNLLISFDFDSAALRADQKPKLNTLCQVMQSIDVQVFQIVGHTDSSGSADYNERLSQLRAEEVKRYLVNDCGIDENRLQAVGMGEAYPFNAADPRSDENRRVEFQALG